MSMLRGSKHKYMYDLLVLGAGSGGVRAARIAGKHGAKVGLIEASMHHGPPTFTAVGGTCVNVGCVPKKLFVYGSHYSHDFGDASGYGWKNLRGYDHDWKTLIENKNKEIDRLNAAYGRILKAANVETIEAFGTLVDNHTISCKTVSGDTKELTAETILIAVGGWPFKPDIPGIEHVITSNEAFYLKERPERLVIVGGGYIAAEFACIFHGYGTKVTQLYRKDLFLRGFDTTIRLHLAEQMRKKGIDLRFNTDPVEIKKTANGTFIVKTNNNEEIECDQVFYATGRKAKTAEIGLETAGVKLDKNGSIIVNEYSRSSVPNIYAVGDVTDRMQLTPVALHEGHCFADTLYGGMDRKPDYEYIASAVFSTPEIGTVGYTEEDAAEKFKNLIIYTSSFTPMLHTMTGRDEKSLFKIIVDETTDRVVGVHMCGPNGAEIMQGIAIAVKMGATKADFDRTIGIHPSSAEEFVTMREAKYFYKDGNKVESKM